MISRISRILLFFSLSTLPANVGITALSTGIATPAVTPTVGSLSPLPLTFQNPSASSIPSRYVTIGQAFKPGDVLPTSTLKLTTASIDFPIQMDAKATWSDGSVRHAVLTFLGPALAGNATQAATLSLGTAINPSCAPTSAALIASGYDATHVLAPATTPPTGYTNLGSTITTSAATLLGGSPVAWLAGCLVNEWRVKTTINSNTLRVTMDIRTYADGTTQTDVTTGNDWWFQSGKLNLTYNATITQAGATTYTASNVPHFIYARWHQVMDPAVRLHVQRAKTYDLATGMLPRLDTSNGVDSTRINNDYASLTGAAVAPITGAGTTGAGSGSGGFHEEVGPVPGWVGRYLLDQGFKSFAVVLANADAWMGMPMHWPDENTGLPTIKAPTSADSPPWGGTNTYPNFSNDSFQQVQGNISFLQPVNGWWRGNNPWAATNTSAGIPWQWDPNGFGTHLPDLMYPAYLFTGRHVYLDEVEFLAGAVVHTPSAAAWTTNGQQGWGGNASYRFGAYALGGYAQVRQLGGAMRAIGHAAAILPDSDLLKSYFTAVNADSLDYLKDYYITTDTMAQWLGPDIKFTLQGYGNWAIQSDFMIDSDVDALSQVAGLGLTNSAKAKQVAAWLTGHVGGRYTHGADGMVTAAGNQYGFFFTKTVPGANGDYTANPSTGLKTWLDFYNTNVANYSAGYGIPTPGIVDLQQACAPVGGEGYAEDDLGGNAQIVTATGDLRALKAFAYLAISIDRTYAAGNCPGITTLAVYYQNFPIWPLAPALPCSGKYLERSQFVEDVTGAASVTLTAPSDGKDHLVATAGATSSVLNGAPNVCNILYARDGTATLNSGAGSTGYSIGGAGAATLNDNTGNQTYLTGDAATTIAFRTDGGGQDQIGYIDADGLAFAQFNSSRDFLNIKSNINGSGLTTPAAVCAAATVSGGSTTLNLGSGNTVLLVGVGSCPQSRITVS